MKVVKLLKNKTFPDGDSFIDRDFDVKGEDIAVFTRLYPDQNNRLIELFLALYHLKKSAKSIKLLVPYIPYSREPQSFKFILDALAQAGCSELHTIDCHHLKGKERATISGISIHNYSMKQELVKYMTRTDTITLSASFGIMIAPDEGASYLCNNTMIKTRDENRQVSTLELGDAKISKDHTIIIDDMISTGSTMIRAIKLLRESGVKKITVLTTHGLFLNNSYEEISKYVDKIICSDSVFSASDISCEKFLMEKLQGKNNQYEQS